MTQMKQLTKSINDTLVFNEDTWKLVKSFFEERYSDYSILIVDVDEIETEFDNFDDAYEYIFENRQTILAICIDGLTPGNYQLGKVVFRNNLKSSYSQPTVLVNIE